MQKKFDDNLFGPPTPPDSGQIFQLVQDVWLHILPLCGIRGVLAIGQTCKRLRALACDKYVWLVLIRDLEERLFLDIPPGTQLHALSTSTLISLARRAVRGPRTWSPANGCPPTISRTHRVHPRMHLGPGILSWENETKLLPGGRYLLFSNWRNLECWNVAEDRLIWVHKSAWKGANVLKFAAEMVDSGKAAVVVVCQRTFGHVPRRKNIVEIIRLDFVTETSQLLLLTYAPCTGYDNPFNRPQISGDLVSVEIQGTDQTLLIKLSTSEAMLLYPGPHDLAVIEGYLVISMVDKGLGTVNLDVLAEEALQPFWQSASVMELVEARTRREEDGEEEEEIDKEVAFWKVMSAEDVRGLVSWTIEIPAVRRQMLSAHKCPMVEGGEYVVWVYVSTYPTGNQSGEHHLDTRVGPAVHSSIYKFRLTLPLGYSGDVVCPSLRQVVTTSAGRDWPIHEEISYAGHTAIYDHDHGVKERVLALAEPQIWDRGGDRIAVQRTEGNDPDEATLITDQVRLDGCGDYIHMSTYSGALTYSTSRELVVNYYE